jgi:hypothetical protein
MKGGNNTMQVLIAIMLSLFALSWSGQAEELSKIKAEMEQVQTLREEITLLNLLNGLNLTDEQSRNILNLAKEASAIREGSLMENAQLLAEFKAALLNLREGLADKNWKPDSELEKRAGQLNHKLKETREKTSDRLQALAEEAKGVLTPGQLAIVADFKPCLIPPKDLLPQGQKGWGSYSKYTR